MVCIEQNLCDDENEVYCQCTCLSLWYNLFDMEVHIGKSVVKNDYDDEEEEEDYGGGGDNDGCGVSEDEYDNNNDDYKDNCIGGTDP